MSYTLTAVSRTTKGEKARQEGQLPAVVYGAEKEAVSIAFNPAEFEKLFRQAGSSNLIDLSLDGKEAGKIIVQDVQVDPVSERIIHVDLRRINMNKEMTAPVTLNFIGESPVVKAQGGTMVTNLNEVEVKCLPKDLVSSIDVDLSVLTTFDDVIKVKDIKVPDGITIVSPNADDLVAKASPALTEEEIKAMEEANSTMDVSKIESAKPEKPAEGEEGGATAPEEKKAE